VFGKKNLEWSYFFESGAAWSPAKHVHVMWIDARWLQLHHLPSLQGKHICISCTQCIAVGWHPSYNRFSFFTCVTFTILLILKYMTLLVFFHSFDYSPFLQIFLQINKPTG
jgi:hypothetical protein